MQVNRTASGEKQMALRSWHSFHKHLEGLLLQVVSKPSQWVQCLGVVKRALEVPLECIFHFRFIRKILVFIPETGLKCESKHIWRAVQKIGFKTCIRTELNVNADAPNTCISPLGNRAKISLRSVLFSLAIAELLLL